MYFSRSALLCCCAMKAASVTSTDIPQFALYGETELHHVPEFVHIEDIHERSSRNGWEILPHRHSHLFQLLCMYSGEVSLQLDTQQAQRKGCWLLTMPTGVVHGFRFHPSTQGVVLSLALPLLGLDAENQLAALLDSLQDAPLQLQLGRRDPVLRELRDYLERIRLELATPRADRQLALNALVKLVLLTLRRLRTDSSPLAGLQEAGPRLVQQFRSLLEQHYREHWKIGDYAQALHVSESTLNRACRAALAQSAKQLLQQRLHLEAKRRLLYTRETLDQIAWGLGYKDAAYFSRVFKEHEGLAPASWRSTHSKP
jgi:AraC family transcriptional activator of pobA